MEKKQRKRKSDAAKYVLLAPGAIILTLCFILPLLYLFMLCVYQGIPGSGLIDTTSPGFDNFVRFMEPYNLMVLWRTLRIAFMAALGAFLVGYPIAYSMTKGSNRKKSIMLALILTPLVTNVVARTLGLMIIFGNSGPINSVIEALGFEGIKFLNTEFGIVLGLVQVYTPYMVLSIKAVLENTNYNLQEAARDMGCTKWQAFTKVIFPLSTPGVVAGTLFVFLLSFSSYVTPRLMGGETIMTMSMYVYQQGMILLDWPFAATVALILLSVSLLLVTLYNKATSRVERMNDQTGLYRDNNFTSKWHVMKNAVKDFGYNNYVILVKKLHIDSFWSKYCSKAFEIVGGLFIKLWVILGVGFIVSPLPIVVISSFTAARLVYFPPNEYSIKWYTGLLEKTEYIRSFIVSLQLAALAVCIALVVGTMVALALTRYRFRFTNFLRTFFLSPLMVPGVIFGLAAVRFAALIGWSASFQALLCAHIIICSTYVIRTVLSGLIGFNGSLEEASRDLGASAWQTFWRVTFPIIRPSIIVAGLFSFIVSLDETTVSVFLVGGQSVTLPVRIFSQLSYGLEPTITAISSILVIFAVVILLIIDKVLGLHKFKI